MDLRPLLAELELFLAELALSDLAGSVLLVLVLLAIRFLAIRYVRARTEAAPALQRRWVRSVKNLFLLLILIGLVLIWAPQLRTFALSLTAVAVAIVVATKELLLCFSGSFLRTTSRSFVVGDWIEVAGLRGEVVDHDVFVTTLQELGEGPGANRYTGRRIVLPNSIFLSQPVRNQSHLKGYQFHHFDVVVESAVNIYAEAELVRDIVERHYAPYREEAARHTAQIERHGGIDLVDPEARVRFGTTEIGKYRVTVSLFCPTEIADAIESGIVRELMDRLHLMGQEAKTGR